VIDVVIIAHFDTAPITMPFLPFELEPYIGSRMDTFGIDLTCTATLTTHPFCLYVFNAPYSFLIKKRFPIRDMPCVITCGNTLFVGAPISAFTCGNALLIGDTVGAATFYVSNTIGAYGGKNTFFVCNIVSATAYTNIFLVSFSIDTVVLAGALPIGNPVNMLTLFASNLESILSRSVFRKELCCRRFDFSALDTPFRISHRSRRQLPM